MNTGKALFFGLALIALAIFATDIMKPANAGLMGSGRYVAAGGPFPANFGIIDTETGAARSCITKGKTKGCTPWIK
jgi:hypothetical protein